MELAMGSEVSVGVYRWYQQVKKKDLGETRRDWLQYLRDQARLRRHNDNTVRCMQDDAAERNGKIEEEKEEEEEKRRKDADESTLNVGIATHSGRESPILQRVLSTPQNSHKRRNVQGNNQNELEAENMTTKSKKARYSSPTTPKQEMRSPFSMFQEPGFITPTLVLRKGDIGTPDLSLFSPTVPISDIFSPRTSTGNCTGDIVTSLGGNLDESLVTWTSALATPTSHPQAGEQDGRTSPSTLERLTLHPKQGLRQNVMARSLFSPHTRSVESPSRREKCSPGLGVIKGLSPLPVFINKLTTEVVEKTNIDNESKEKFLINDTQTFRISLGKRCMESMEEDSHEKVQLSKGRRRRSIVTTDTENGFPLESTPDTRHTWTIKGPERTSTPVRVTPQSRTSLFPRHLVLADDVPEPQECSEMIQVTQIDHKADNAKETEKMQTPETNIIVREHLNTNHIRVSLQSDVTENSDELSVNPLDLICSPVKVVSKKCVEGMNSEAKLKNTCQDVTAGSDVKIMSSGTNMRKPDAEEQPVIIGNIPQNIDTCTGPDLNITYNSDVNHHLEMYNPNSKLLLPSEAEIIHEKAEEKFKDNELKESFMTRNQSTDNSPLILEAKTPEQSGQCISEAASHGSLSVPLFKKTSCKYLDSNEESPGRDASDGAKTPISTSSDSLQGKSILNKLSLRKKKNLSGKFLYPSKSEEGYEKLKMTYTETIGLVESSSSSFPEPQPPISKIQSACSTSSVLKVSPDIHSIANKQQNFLSLTSLEKDTRFESNDVSLSDKTTYSPLGFDKEKSSSPRNQLVPADGKRLGSQWSSSRRVCVASPVTSVGAVGTAFDDPHDTFTDADILTISTQGNSQKPLNSEQVYFNTALPKSKYCNDKVSRRLSGGLSRKLQQNGDQSKMVASEFQVVPERDLTEEENTLAVSSYSHGPEHDQLASPHILQQERFSQIMNDSLNDVYLSEMDTNPCVPVVDEVVVKSRTGEVQQASVLDLGGTGAPSNTLAAETDDKYQNDSRENIGSGFYTSRGKQMIVSKEALEHAKKLVKELPSDGSLMVEDTSSDKKYTACVAPRGVIANDKTCQFSAPVSISGHFPTVCSFTTARGSRVTVNPAAVAKAKKLWEEENCVTECDPENSDTDVQDHSNILHKVLQEKKVAIAHDDRDSLNIHALKTDTCVTVQADSESLLNKSCQMLLKRTKDCVDGRRCDGRSNDMQDSSSKLVNKYQCVGAPDEASSSVRGFQGFSTASGSKINISKEALKKAKLLWEENTGESDPDEHKTVNIQKSARSGRRVPDASHTLQSERQGSRCSPADYNVSEGTVLSADSSNSPKLKTSQSAVSKSSHSGVCEAQSLLNESENLKSHLRSEPITVNIIDKCNERSMKTLPIKNNSPVPQSKHNMAACISNENTNVSHTSSIGNIYHQSKGESFSGFHTARGKRVSLTEAAIARAKTLWEESDCNVMVTNNSTSLQDDGNKLILSSRIPLLEKQGNILSENLAPSLEEQSNITQQNALEKPQPLQFCKSEQSLFDVRLPLNTSYKDYQRAGTSNLLSKLVIKQEETKQYHLDEEKQSYLLNEMNRDTGSICSAPSFATARGKRIFISKEALCKAKNILSEDVPSNNDKEVNRCTEQSSYNHKQVQGKESGTKLEGLRRADGAEAHVSQGALEKAHKFLTEDKVDEKHIITWPPQEAPIENVNINNENKLEASKSGCGDGASVHSSTNINERGEIQGDGKHFTENLCMVNVTELHSTETEYINALAGEARGVDKSSETSEGAGQPLSTKTKLSVCMKKPAQTWTLDDKTSKASSKDTQSSSAEFKERICNINTDTEASRDPACINIGLSGTPEPTEEINKSFVEDGDMLENSAHRSPSPILGSQKCREISVNRYANLAVNMRLPAQRNLKVHNYNRNQLQNCVSDVDGNLHLPLPSIEAENHSKGTCELKSIIKNPHSSDNVEITEITEAFLNDDDWEQEETQKGLVLRRKRRQELTQEKQDNSDTNSKMQRLSTDIVQLTDESVTPPIQDCDAEVAAEREMLRLKQIKIIRSKETVRVQPIQGSLHKIRSERKMERRPLQSLGALKIFRGWKKVTAKTAVKYQFQVEDKRCSSVACGDECSVVPDVCGCIGVKQIEEGFLAMPGVQPGLLPPGWLTNHYRWIVWKLAALERRLLNCQALTLENIIARLKYRYDREIDRAERPVLRKITERDDIPQKTMILCVVNIMTVKHGTSDVASNEMKPVSPSGQKDLLELTDGWYSIGAVVDDAMSRLLREGRVEIGTKLVIHGAELMGSSEACHPLEAPSTLQLRLHTNMTRRARWWSCLGLVPQKGPMHTLIGATLSDGGLVGRMNLTLARVYPLVYFERSNGRPMFRGEKAHMRILKETQQEKEALMHKVVAEVERELSKETKENQQEMQPVPAMTKEEIRNLTMGRDIAKLMDQVKDPSSLEGLLSRQQVELARSWQQHQAEDRRRNINREVERRMASHKVIYEATPLLKMRVVDHDGGGALVTIWRPSEDLRQTLTEGRHVCVCYLMAAGIRNGSVQLTATRQTRWERDTEHPPNSFTEFERHVTPLCLMSSGEFEPMWKEVDVVGVVLRVGLLDKGSQIVHIVDHHLNIVALKFWGGVKECGVEDIVKICSVVCVLNGSWRGHTGGRFGCVHITELTTITTAPRSAYLHEAVTHLKESIKNMKNLLQEGDMKLDGQFDRRAFPADLVSVRGQTQVVEVEPCLQDGTNVCKLESGAATNDASLLNNSSETVTDPKLVRACQRSREVRGKLKTLGQYGMPSPLRTLPSPATLGVRKPFRVPFKQPQKCESGEDKSV
ncbi:breast cancer type 2 susceptibility protein-like isoform X2 [Procambarus clarkii]